MVMISSYMQLYMFSGNCIS